MTDAQKTRQTELKAKNAEGLTDAEKSELELLDTIEKQANQITEKDSLIGTRATELDNLKKELEQAKDGSSEKEALEQRIAEKQEAIDTANAGLSAIKEAQAQTQKLAEKFPTHKPGDGGDADPKEIARLETAAKGNETATATLTRAVENMTDEEYQRYRTDPSYKLSVLKMAVPEGEPGARTPWADEEEPGGAPPKTEEDRLKELFGEKVNNGRNLPPGSSGRPGHPGYIPPSDKPKARERTVDARTY